MVFLQEGVFFYGTGLIPLFPYLRAGLLKRGGRSTLTVHPPVNRMMIFDHSLRVIDLQGLPRLERHVINSLHEFNLLIPSNLPANQIANYRKTLRGVRSFMGWHHIPDYDNSVASMDDNPFAGSRVKATGKVSVKLPVDEWLCKKLEKLNVTIAEGYPYRNSETSGLLRDQFVKTPRSSKWYDMHAVKKGDVSTQTVSDWSPEPAKLNSMFSSQDTLRRWEKAFREQSLMCNHAAGLSRCLTKVQDSMVTQLKSLRSGSSKGKSAERTQQAVEELEYLVTFNRSISQAMQRTMQDLSEGVFISMANLTLARRDSYLEFLRGGVKPDTLTALRTSPVHLLSLFPDSLLVKAEDEISLSEERHSVGNTQRKPGRFHPYVPSSGRSPHPARPEAHYTGLETD